MGRGTTFKLGGGLIDDDVMSSAEELPFFRCPSTAICSFELDRASREIMRPNRPGFLLFIAEGAVLAEMLPFCVVPPLPEEGFLPRDDTVEGMLGISGGPNR